MKFYISEFRKQKAREHRNNKIYMAIKFMAVLVLIVWLAIKLY